MKSKRFFGHGQSSSTSLVWKTQLGGIAIGAMSYRSVASILKNGLDKAFLPEVAAEADPIQHDNIRGGTYFH